MEPLSIDVFPPPDTTQLARVVVRLIIAAVLGWLIGAEREAMGKAAGARTHILVSLGAALFVIVPSEIGLREGDLGRVVQGLATGIGFIGAGTILKRTDRDEITGLTTAATIWLTAAIGLAVGVGQIWIAALCAAGARIILSVAPFGDRRESAANSREDS